MDRRWSYLNFLFALGLFFLNTDEAVADSVTVPPEYQLVRDCREDWLVYSAQYQNYVPYISSIHESEPSVSILLHLVRDRRFTFVLKTNTEVFLFIDGALQKTLSPNNWHFISCDSLYNKYGRTELMLTVFGLRTLEGVSSAIVSPLTAAATDSVSVLSPSLISLKIKSVDVFRDFSVIAWILILMISAIVFLATPAVAYRLVSVVAFFSRDFRSELYNHHRAYSPVIVVMVAVLALITAFLLLAIERNIGSVLPATLWIHDRKSMWGLIGNFGKITVLCFLLFYFKYFVISVTSGILNMSEIAHIHFIKTLQSSLLFYSLISMGLLLAIFQAPGLLSDIGAQLLWGVIIYYCVRYVVLYILLNQSNRILNLYLISYLCVVELIPLIIGIKFIM